MPKAEPRSIATSTIINTTKTAAPPHTATAATAFDPAAAFVTALTAAFAAAPAVALTVLTLVLTAWGTLLGTCDAACIAGEILPPVAPAARIPPEIGRSAALIRRLGNRPCSVPARPSVLIRPAALRLSSLPSLWAIRAGVPGSQRSWSAPRAALSVVRPASCLIWNDLIPQWS